jgi:hypothetical protein
MGYRGYEKAYGSMAESWNTNQIASWAGKEDDYYANRTIQPGYRQEDWRDIQKYGDRSDTDWETTFRDNLQNLRRNYAPKGEWAKRSDMDQASQHLYDYMINTNKARAARSKPVMMGTGSGRDSGSGMSYSEFKNYESQGKVSTISGSPREGGQTYSVQTGRDSSQSFTEEDVQMAESRQAQGRTDAKLYAGKASEARAKWMAEYNKNLNVHEQIEVSKRRTAYRERYADMRIQQERTERIRTRQTLKQGTSGLNTGIGSGLKI